MKSVKDIAGAAWGALPGIGLPEVGRTVEIPVYMIHNSASAEDYFFLFDFEEFVERSRDGVFVRPKLLIWAGRRDFDRGEFAHQFRVAFSREFDAARASLAAQGGKVKRGWFDWNLGFDLASQLVANVILLIALTAGRQILKALPFAGIGSEKSDTVKLEDSIRATQAKVDGALRDVDVVVHRDLWKHAASLGWSGDPGDVAYEAWPLPGFVVRHLGDGESRSWW